MSQYLRRFIVLRIKVESEFRELPGVFVLFDVFGNLPPENVSLQFSEFALFSFLFVIIVCLTADVCQVLRDLSRVCKEVMPQVSRCFRVLVFPTDTVRRFEDGLLS